jgi:hypothetical protein
MKSRSNNWNRLLVAVLGLAVGASVASAQIVVESQIEQYQGTATNIHTLSAFETVDGSDRKLVVVTARESATADVTGITYGSQNFTQVVATDGYRKTDIWYLDAPDIGTQDVVITFADNCRARTGVMSLQHAVPGDPALSDTNQGTVSYDLTTTASNTFVVGVYNENNGGIQPSSTSFTATLVHGPGGSCEVDGGWINEEVPGLKTYSWTADANACAIAIAGFESFASVAVTPSYLTPYADDYTTLGLWHMETIRSAKYMDDDDSNTPGRDADWILSPNTTNAPPMVSVVDPSTNSVGYPVGNADFSNCMYFPGIQNTGAILVNGNIPEFDITNVRIEGWCKEDGTENEPKSILFDRWGQVVFYLTDTGFQLLAFEGGGLGNNWYSINPAGFSTTNWNHWAVEFGAQVAKVYVNGNLEGGISLPAGLADFTRSGTVFGKRYNGASFFKGWMDEVRISIPNPILLTYSDWANSYGLTGSDTNLAADLEFGGVGDGLNNLAEWAYGGNPLVDDADSVGPAYVGDETELGMTYGRLQGADELGVEYIVETTTDLVYGSWTTNETIDESFVNASTEYQDVISAVAVDTAAKKFLRLFVESGPQSVTPPEADLCAYEVPLAATTPTIDGVLTGAEYADAHVIHLEYPSVTNCGSVKYQEASAPDFAVDYYLKWDATYLYVCVVVVDDLLVFSANGTQAYPNDHMNIAIDPWRAGSGSADIAFYEMYRSDSGTSTNTAIQYRDIGINDPALAPDNAVIGSSVQAGVGYTIEAAFAWADLNMVPAVDQKHRFLMFPADKDVATPDFGGIDEGNTGTFFFDGQGAGGTVASVGVPTSYVNITLADEL